ncbi:MAG TPA: hypothetical protein VMS56_05605 [Thermoanaerobaculia bacterium]|nr:hypothetical protein [Thermoanaerobaculia bacterium]
MIELVGIAEAMGADPAKLIRELQQALRAEVQAVEVPVPATVG